MVDEHLFARSLFDVFAAGSVALDVWGTVSRKPNLFADFNRRAIYLGLMLHGNATHSHVWTLNTNIDQRAGCSRSQCPTKHVAHPKIRCHRCSHGDGNNAGSLVALEARRDLAFDALFSFFQSIFWDFCSGCWLCTGDVSIVDLSIIVD